MAVGLSVKKENLSQLQSEFEKIAKESGVDKLYPILLIDSVENVEDLSVELVKSLQVLEPFGEENRNPIFAFKNLKISSIRTLTDGKHIKLTLQSNNTYIEAIGFNLGYLADEFIIGDKVDVVGSIELNSFGGVESVQINLKDVIRRENVGI